MEKLCKMTQETNEEYREIPKEILKDRNGTIEERVSRNYFSGSGNVGISCRPYNSGKQTYKN